MTGRKTTALMALVLAGCLDWEPVDDAVVAGDPQPPAVRRLTPAGLPPLKAFDTGELAERCRTVCTRYVECFGPAVDLATCEAYCTSELWVQDEDDLACFLSSGCTELYHCYSD